MALATSLSQWLPVAAAASGRLVAVVAQRGLATTASKAAQAAVPEPDVQVSETQQLIDIQKRHGAKFNAPLEGIAIQKGEGPYVWDMEGKKYFDFNMAYSACNQGHRHPRIVEAAKQQMDKLTITSDAFYNDSLPKFLDYITETLGYDRCLPMNAGAEALDTAIKIARKWGYDHKGVAPGKATILFCQQNFHGRTLGAISGSTQPRVYGAFAPLMPGFEWVNYNDIASLEAKLEENPNVVAMCLEPIQGEGGVNVPDDGYLAEVHRVLKKHNALMIADEVQAGMGRTGHMLACQHDGVKPDITLLGKSLSGGILPVSAVLADDEVMLTLKYKEHGTTFGGYPLAAAVAVESLKVLTEEKLCENAVAMHEVFKRELGSLPPSVSTGLRGRGLMMALEISPEQKFTAKEVCHAMAERGLLAMPVQDSVIRLYPALTITEPELKEALSIVRETMLEFAAKA